MRCAGALRNTGAACWNEVACCAMAGLLGCAARASVTAMAAIAVSVIKAAILAVDRLADERSRGTSQLPHVLSNPHDLIDRNRLTYLTPRDSPRFWRGVQ